MATFILGWFASAECQGQGGVAASFALQSSSVSLHEPVVVYMVIHNGLAEKANVDLGYDREGALEFSLVQPDGSTSTAPHLRRRQGISRLPELSLGPDETYWQELVLNEWYPFSKPGNYKIQMRLDTAIGKDSTVPAMTEFSQDLYLQVGPLDEQRLEKVCEGLASAAMQMNAETALDAARSLSYFDDAVAVPYLARLTRHGPYAVVTKNVALQGLGRIAHSEGVEAVISRLTPEDRKWEAEIKAWAAR